MRKGRGYQFKSKKSSDESDPQGIFSQTNEDPENVYDCSYKTLFDSDYLNMSISIV